MLYEAEIPQVGLLDNPALLLRYCGVNTFQLRVALSIAEPRPAVAAFGILKHGHGYDKAELDWETVLGGPPMDVGNFGRLMRSTMAALSQIPLPPPDVRLEEGLVGCPNVHTMIDTFPVAIRGKSTDHVIKYGKRILKAQLLCTVRSRPLAVMFPVAPRINDGEYARTAGVGIDLEPDELVLADKAYIGGEKFLTPYKIYTSISQNQARYNKWHQLCRGGDERVNARLGAFAMLRCARFSRTTTVNMVRIIVALDSLIVPLATEFVVAPCLPTPYRDHVHPGDPRHEIIRFLIEGVGIARWEGKASTNRAKGAPAYKEATFPTELDCAKCNTVRSQCMCPKEVKKRAKRVIKEEKDQVIAARKREAATRKTAEVLRKRVKKEAAAKKQRDANAKKAAQRKKMTQRAIHVSTQRPRSVTPSSSSTSEDSSSTTDSSDSSDSSDS